MSIVEPTEENIKGKDFPQKWEFFSGDNVYQFQIALIKSEGCYESFVVNLPGALSYGDTVDDAVKYAIESAVGLLESYKAHGEDIPWDYLGEWYETDETPILKKWILVHV